MAEEIRTLNATEAAMMEKIREAVPNPTKDTVMQAVVDPSYLEPENKEYIYNRDFGSMGITGYIYDADDVFHLDTPEKIYHGLRLDYIGSRFSSKADKITVIRFNTNDTDDIVIPYGDHMPNPTGGMVSGHTYPKTGNGFVATVSDDIIPEYYTTRVYIEDGAILMEIDKKGSMAIVGMFDYNSGKFDKVVMEV